MRQARARDPEAQYNLGFRYAVGDGVLKDADEAARWFRLAAGQVHASAQCRLGVMYRNGEGVLRDVVLAHMWFNIAGANGNEAAGEARDMLERDMTRAQIRRATELARSCMASNYRNCEVEPVGSVFSKEIGDRIYQLGGDVSEPVVIRQVQPEYSEEAREARYEGVVRLDAIIHKDGSVQVLGVLQSLGFGLDEKAIDAIEQWQFRPGMLNGEPVAVSMNIEVTFNLR